jgi:hypothetical protein
MSTSSHNDKDEPWREKDVALWPEVFPIQPFNQNTSICLSVYLTAGVSQDSSAGALGSPFSEVLHLAKNFYAVLTTL